MRRGLIAPVTLVVLLGMTSAANAQATDAPASGPEAQAAARVHDEGGYPSDIVVIDDDDGGDATARGRGSEGAGHGPTGRIGHSGDRDGGDPNRSFDIPMPEFVRDLLRLLGELFGTAALPIGYFLLALGIAIVIALVVFLVVTMRLPRGSLQAELRRRGDGAAEPALDPLLEGSNVSAEEHAAHGRFREAIHALFLRALRDATLAGDVDRRGRTAREVVRLVERAHGELPPLVALLSLTELVWFGGRAATEAQYLEARGMTAEAAERVAAMGPPSPLGAPA